MILPPLVLSTTLTVARGATAAPIPSALLEAKGEADLRNPSGGAMLIDRINWYVAGTDTSPNSADGLFALRSSFSIGRVRLTGGINGFVPTALFAGRTERNRETNNSTGLTDVGGYASWKLPKPLYVPRGELLSPRFWLFNGWSLYTPAATYLVRLTYVGRALPSDFPAPKEAPVPWVTAWLPTAPILSGAAAATINSQEGVDLVNPHPEPVRVARLVGRIAVEQSAALGDSDAIALGAANTQRNTGEIAFNLRLFDSDGRIVIREPTPVGHVCSLIHKTWETRGAQIRPHGSWPAHLDYDVSAYGVTGNYAWPMFALVGHRMVRLDAGRYG